MDLSWVDKTQDSVIFEKLAIFTLGVCFSTNWIKSIWNNYSERTKIKVKTAEISYPYYNKLAVDVPIWRNPNKRKKMNQN